MAYIDNSAIKRITTEDGLESITLRSDLAARYILQNEALLEVFNVIKSPDDEIYKTGITLKEAFPEEKIEDVNSYLANWLEKLKKEVDETEHPLIDSEVNRYLDQEMSTLTQYIKGLSDEFLKPTEKALKEENDKIYSEYTKKFKRTVYEVKGNLTQNSDNLDIGQEEMSDDEDEYKGSIYYRLTKPVKFSNVEYKKGEYKRRKVETGILEAKQTSSSSSSSSSTTAVVSATPSGI